VSQRRQQIKGGQEGLAIQSRGCRNKRKKRETVGAQHVETDVSTSCGESLKISTSGKEHKICHTISGRVHRVYGMQRLGRGSITWGGRVSLTVGLKVRVAQDFTVGGGRRGTFMRKEVSPQEQVKSICHISGNRKVGQEHLWGEAI